MTERLASRMPRVPRLPRLAPMLALVLVAALLPVTLGSGAGAEPSEGSTPVVADDQRRMTAGGLHTCAVLDTGEVQCWGANANGELGNGTTTASTVPRKVVGITTALGVSAGTNHTCAVIHDGTVRCWGSNGSGQLGNDSTSPPAPPVLAPVQVKDLDDAVALAAGGFHTCALRAGGKVACWGADGSGQLGDGGSTGSSYVLTAVRHDHDADPATAPVELTGATAVTSGEFHSCALLGTGGVACWGHNGFGQLGNGSTADSTVAANVSGLPDDDEHSHAPHKALAVSAGQSHTCAVLDDNTLRCWGHDFYGQLGDNASGAGTDKTTPAKVLFDVDGSPLTPDDVEPLGTVVAVTTGQFHSCAALAGGTVRCWGNNGKGQLGDGSTTDRKLAVPVVGLSTARAVTAGGFHTCALVGGNAMRCWGHNFHGQLGGFAASRTRPDAVTALTGATLVTNGDGHACALVTTASTPPADQPVCWGNNANGELGAGLSSAATPNSTVPVPVAGIADADAVTAGNGHVCALPAGIGTPQCWGRNGSGQLGDGTTTARNAPVAVVGLPGAVTQLSAGGQFDFFAPGAESGHTCARLSDGSVQCWGRNASGQLGNDPTTSDGPLAVVSDHDNDHDKADPTPPVPLAGAVAVTAGGSHSCALMTDRTVRCWGRNGNGQLGDGSTTERHFAVVVDTDPEEPEDGDDHVDPLADVAAVTAGANHTCAMKVDATVVCWGRNSDGQLGNGTTNPSDVPVPVAGIPPSFFTVVEVAAGDAHTCARLRSNGDNNVSAACWGDNAFGQLGVAGGDRVLPVAPAGLGEPGGSVTNVELVKGIGGSRRNSCAALIETAVYCWGDNASGQLGDGIGPTVRTPIAVQNLSSVGGNSIPAPVDDAATVAAPPISPVTIDVLANDGDPDGHSLTVAAVTGPPRGTATTDGATVAYDPNDDFCTADPTSNTDSFQYSATDGTATVPATVTITVTCPNTAPSVVADAASTSEETPVDIAVTANDSDLNGDAVSVEAGSPTDPPNGSVVLKADGKTIAYTPDADFSGTDQFTYRATDATDASTPATVTVTVSGVNDPPVAVDDPASTDEDTAATIDVLFNDTDVDGPSLGVSAVGDAPHGTATVAGVNMVEYTPDPGYCGPDGFSYTVSDGTSTDEADVDVTVNCVNDGPNAVDDSATTAEDTPVTIQVLANDTDPEGDSLAVDAITVAPEHGTAAIDAGGTSVTYTPAANFCGADQFGYRATDGSQSDAALVVPVAVLCNNDAPDAVDDGATLAEDGSVLIDVLANDADVDHDPLTVTSASDPANGTASVGSGNVITYAPDADFCGADSFTYTVRDPDGASDTATVAVTVTCVNDAPRVTAAADQTTPWGEQLVVPLTAVDPDGDAVTWSLVAGPAGAGVSGTDLSWTPEASQVGPHTLTVRASDGTASSDDSLAVDVTKRATVMAYSGDTAGQYSDPANVGALVEDADGNPVPGLGVTLKIGSRSATATTDSLGAARAQIVLDNPVGPTTVDATFAGDAAYLPSSTTSGFTVRKELVTVTFTGRHVTTTSGTSGPVQLTATLAEDADGHLGSGLATLQVRFTEVGAGTLCTASVTSSTPGQGSATCTSGLLPLGSRGVVAKLLGGSYGGPVDVGAFVVAQTPSGSAAGAGRIQDGGSTDDFAFQARPVRRSAPTGDVLHVRRAGGVAVVDLSTSLTSLSTSCSGGKQKVCSALVEGGSAFRWSVDLADGTVTALGGLPTVRVHAQDSAEPNGAGADAYAVEIGGPDSYSLGTAAAPLLLAAGNVRIPS